jgi:hypothetical protein
VIYTIFQGDLCDPTILRRTEESITDTVLTLFKKLADLQDSVFRLGSEVTRFLKVF